MQDKNSKEKCKVIYDEYGEFCETHNRSLDECKYIEKHKSYW